MATLAYQISVIEAFSQLSCERYKYLAAPIDLFKGFHAMPLDWGTCYSGDFDPSGSREFGHFASALAEIQILSITPFS